MSKLNKTECFSCEFCGSKFSHNYNLTKHLKTSKKCLESRPKIDIKCIWCEEVFLTKDKLEKHSSKCGIDKENSFISILEKNKALEYILEEKNKLLSDKDTRIKELEEKVFALANKTSTTNNTTYNITLNCDKPLMLSKERVTDLMWKYLTVHNMLAGGLGYGVWFLKYVAINDKGNICIECTDKNRKIFKYIDEGDKLVTKEGREIAELIRECYQKSGFLTKSPQGIEFLDFTSDCYNSQNASIINDFNNFQKAFIRHLVEQTHKSNLTTLITEDN
jgi:hypothetical protein